MLALLLLAPLAAYAGTLRYQFVFDDPEQIVTNGAVHSWSSIPQFFTSDVWPHTTADEVGNFYRPVFLLWLLVNYKVGGLNPVWWHAVTIVAHLLVTFLLYLVILQMTRNEFLAFGSALLFGLHPIHIEAVAWVSGATEPLLAIFFLASFLCYLKSRAGAEGQTTRRVWWLAASLGFYVLAILEKETALILPVVIFSHSYIFGGEENVRQTSVGRTWMVSRSRIPGDQDKLKFVLLRFPGIALLYVPLTIIYFIVRYLALKGISHPLTRLSWTTTILTWPSILFFYFKSLVWPLGLSAFYDTPYVNTVSWRQVIVPLIILLLVACVLGFWARRSRLAAFFSLWMLLPLLPLLNISIFKEGEIAHDRYLYLPSIGLCVLVVLALSQIKFAVAQIDSRPPAIAVVLVLILAGFFGIATFYQSPIWASDFSLASRGVAIAPNNAMAANNLGKELALRGDYKGAVPLFLKAVERRPRYWLANFNLGYVYYRVGNFTSAEIYLRKAIAIFPKDAAEQRFLSYTLLEMGRTDEAEAVLRQAIDLRNDAPNQHFVLGTILRDRKDFDGALREFRLELTFNPGNQQARQSVTELEGQRSQGKPVSEARP